VQNEETDMVIGIACSTCGFWRVVLDSEMILLIAQHGSCLLAPCWISKALSKSNSMIAQVPETIDAANSIAKVGFAVHFFSIGESEDVESSDKLEDALGGCHEDA
jgi:hypothetical protein